MLFFVIIQKSHHEDFVCLIQVIDTRVLVVTSQPRMLERLQESNELLEEIHKGLNIYLEKKRLYFPRFLLITI